jgi:DNA-binding CsgD family transcriptional regulator
LKFSLTNREKEIISEILKEKSNSEIGEILQISKRTVETHRKNIMLKLDVKNSIGIAVKALKYELV